MGGVRRARARHAAPALDGGHQGRFFAADEGAGALVDLDVEREVGAQHVRSPRMPRSRACTSARPEALDGERVFGAHVDVAGGGADREGGDRHALDHDVGVALEHRAVHERAGVAFVGVADDVLDLARALAREVPLGAGGKAGAAAAAQPRFGHGLDHVVGVVVGQHLGEGRVAVLGEVVVDRVRVDLAVQREHEAALAGVEGDVAFVGHGLAAGGVLVEALLVDAVGGDAGLDDAGHVGGPHPRVEQTPAAAPRRSGPARRSRDSRSRRRAPCRRAPFRRAGRGRRR